MPGPFMSVASRPRRRLRRAAVVTAAALVVLLVVAAAFGTLALLERHTIARGSTIGGVDVGGLSESQARRVVRREAARRLGRPIRLVAPDGAAITTSGRELGAAPRVAPALEAALDTGALDRVLARLGIRDGPDVELGYGLGPVRAARLANRIDRRFADPPRDADVRIADDAIEVVEAQPGTAVDRGALRRSLRTLPSHVTLSIEPAPPVVATQEARAAARRIERLLDAPRHVRFQDAEATLTPSRLRALVGTERAGRALRVTLDEQGLAASLRVRLGRIETEPRDATFAVDGVRARVVPARPGRVLDLERIAYSLTSNLASTTHRAWFERREPSVTTREAQELGIHERISEFTTYYPCCAPRVTNIRRGAEIMDGTIVRPGERFSLNEVLGRRTPERGFVEAPQIYAGRLEDAVGGGVSQIATTTYNAAFFAGVRLVQHQPHEFYISRYPMGREATVSWGGPELIWRNDWPAAILVKAHADDDSITVQLYSSRLGRRVETTTSDPSEYTAPRTITVSNPSLPPGTTRVVQSAGPSGFLISYTRKVYEGSKLRRNERYTWRYKPENEIVEVGPAKPKTAAP
ncbi:MAG TPA: VanW family protein, partial [Gaiella sp.]|nr:VanW family protein [Gaiella sp.]